MSETPLLPCPFCGAEAGLSRFGDSHWVFCPECETCLQRTESGVHVTGKRAYSKEEVTAAWNRRAPLLSPEEREALEYAERLCFEEFDNNDREVRRAGNAMNTIRALLARTEAKP